jgi:hypothetical protein
MKELMKWIEADKDIRQHPRVVKAYWGFGDKKQWPHDVRLIGGDWQGDPAWYQCVRCKEALTWKGTKDPPPLCQVPAAIPGSLADIAFEMRDACIKREISGQKTDWAEILSGITSYGFDYNLVMSDPNQWIIASVLVWEN